MLKTLYQRQAEFCGVDYVRTRLVLPVSSAIRWVGSSLLLLFGICQNTYAQPEPKTPVKWAYSVGYFGELLTHPGVVAGVEHALLQSERYKLLLAGSVGGYVHVRNHTGLFLDVQSGQRFTFRSGFFLDHTVGLGYLHTFLNGGELYRLDYLGNISKVPNTGRPHVMPSVSVGAGWDVSKAHTGALLLFLRPKIFWQYPFNDYALAHFALQAGLTMHVR